MQEIEVEERHPHGGDWLREIVFGLNDGLVTTLVFILAVATVAHGRVVQIALGELLAGGVSMGLGGYLSSRTANEILERRIATERDEIAHEPEEERAELRAIYQSKGLRGPLLESVIHHLTADDERWLRSMVRDELGVVGDERERPWLQGLLVGVSFMGGALVPIVPFSLGLPSPQIWAYGLTALTALLLGALKARYTLKGVVRNGLELLAVVTIGTLAGVTIGALL
jgi:VIT1/CCC1 family predicted Fe2+/Mn2+ transporter